MAKSKYTHSEIHKYETYIEALRAAIALRVKKQGERKLERSLARSMTSLHRPDSREGWEVDKPFYTSSRRDLRIDPGRHTGSSPDGEEEQAMTPVAARTRGLERV